MKYSLYFVLTFITISWILFLVSIGTTAWLKLNIIDTVIVAADQPLSAQKTLTFYISYNFGLSTYCVKAKNVLLNTTDTQCMRISKKHPDILKELKIDESVLSDIQKFMALTIVFATLAVTSSIVGKICAQKSLHNIIAYISMTFILISGIVCSASVFIAHKSMKADAESLHKKHLSKHGTFIVNELYQGYSYYCGCVGILFLTFAFIIYIVELIVAKVKIEKEEEEGVAYTRLQMSE